MPPLFSSKKIAALLTGFGTRTAIGRRPLNPCASWSSTLARFLISGTNGSQPHSSGESFSVAFTSRDFAEQTEPRAR